jgi:pimeloyl-ACP methyl ester carboxylesterase
MLADHSPRGSVNTLRGVQKQRPSLFDLVDEMRRMTVPTLVMAGDEDDPCLEASLLMKRSIPSAGLAILPRTGHALNLEEPVLYNSVVGDFFHQVEAGRWSLRDPRSLAGRIL